MMRNILLSRLLLALLLPLCLLSCGDDGLEERVDALSKEVAALRAACEARKTVARIEPVGSDGSGWRVVFADHSEVLLVGGGDGLGVCERMEQGDGFVAFVLRDGTVLRFAVLPEHPAPRLVAVRLLAADNALQLVDDADCEIVGDSVADCRVRSMLADRRLRLRLDYEGDSLTAGSVTVTENGGMVEADLSRQLTLTVHSGGLSKTYGLCLHTFTGLPVVWIETAGRSEIASKDEYVRGTVRIESDEAAYTLAVDSVAVKGHGNSTWSLPKKSYRLKLDTKRPLLGMPADRSWLLLANYTDKTMLRNHLAFYMGSLSLLDYTPRSRFVELMLNGRYHGTYQLCEKLKAASHRVDVGDDGYLLEIDAKAGDDDVTFLTNYLFQVPVNIKEPEVTAGDAAYEYVRDYVTHAEAALWSDGMADPGKGWQRYMDMDSFVEWYLINELARNNDAVLYTSCYMHMSRGGKLMMGPLWDFDLGFGNVSFNGNYEPEGFLVRRASWYDRLFADPAFASRVRERFAYYYGRKADIMAELNDCARLLRLAAAENDRRWHTFYTATWPNYDVWGSYDNEVLSLKQWLDARMEWMKEEMRNEK